MSSDAGWLEPLSAWAAAAAAPVLLLVVLVGAVSWGAPRPELVVVDGARMVVHTSRPMLDGVPPGLRLRLAPSTHRLITDPLP